MHGFSLRRFGARFRWDESRWGEPIEILPCAPRTKGEGLERECRFFGRSRRLCCGFPETDSRETRAAAGKAVREGSQGRWCRSTHGSRVRNRGRGLNAGHRPEPGAIAKECCPGRLPRGNQRLPVVGPPVASRLRRSSSRPIHLPHHLSNIS